MYVREMSTKTYRNVIFAKISQSIIRTNATKHFHYLVSLIEILVVVVGICVNDLISAINNRTY